jgi:hypothetical protein
MSVPVVPLSAFSNLAGSALAEDLRRLLANPDYSGLVLFSDTLGEQLAILPVGLAQDYKRIEDLHGAEIEGLRPLCAMRLRAEAPVREKPSSGREQELMQLDESLRARERYIAECEQRLADAGQMLSEREAILEQREQMLTAKERDFFRRSGDLTRQQGEATAAAAAARPV